MRREESYSGPLQPSTEAQRWDALVPGTAARNFKLYEQIQLKRIEMQDRILAISEESARHEMEMDSKRHADDVDLTKTELKYTANKVSRGQWFAFIAFIFVSVGGFYMVHLGNDALGIAILVFEAVGVAGVFLDQFRREGQSATIPDSGDSGTIASDSDS